MNLENRKAIQSHVICLLVAGFFISLLLSVSLNSFFQSDHEKCQYINYEITKKTKANAGVLVQIANKGTVKIDFLFGDDERTIHSLAPQSKQEFNIKTKNPNELAIIPLYIDLKNEMYKCNAKKTRINLKTLI